MTLVPMLSKNTVPELVPKIIPRRDPPVRLVPERSRRICFRNGGLCCVGVQGQDKLAGPKEPDRGRAGSGPGVAPPPRLLRDHKSVGMLTKMMAATWRPR